MAVKIGDLIIDPASHEVIIAGTPVDLRAQEFDLLLTLAENRGRVLSREKLLELAWGFDYFGQTRTVDVHIGHLRRKLVQSSVKIETVTGVGYKLVG
jgi:two-component system alkaline phosphatase synthesis response regulator PhoP